MRLRDLAAVLVGLAVVGAVGYGGWLLLADAGEGPAAPPEPGADPLATVEAYVEAWQQGDHTAMTRLVRDPPEDLVAVHAQLLDGLDPEELRVSAAPLDDEDRAAAEGSGQLDVDLEVSVEVAELDEPLAWQVPLRLLRERGEWGVEWTLSSVHPELRPGWRFGRETEAIDRFPILAADGTPLAGSGGQVIFGFEPTSVDDADEVIAAFAEAIPGSETAAARELGRSDLVEGWFYPVVTVSEGVAEEAGSRLREATGVLRRTAEGRVLLDDGLGYHVVGVVAEATAEQLEQLGDPYEVGDQVGQFGLEAAFETALRGSEIVRYGLREGDEEALRVVLGEGQLGDAEPIETTLDVGVQRAVEAALEGVDEAAAVVVVDAADGAIRGSASRPLSGYNRAFSGRYPPGSTFKVVTAEALAAAGAGGDDEVACPAETTVGGLRVPNAGDRDLGTTDLTTAFAESCNTSFARLGADLGAEPLTEAAARFGFGVEPISPLDAFGGSFPELADTAEVAAASFGQARVEASPLHLATVAAAAWTGTWHQPYLLTADGPGESRSLATGAVDVLRPLLLATVTDGTGTDAAVEGEQVGGKTGTAQATGDVEHAWFIGIWEGLGFAVLVEEGGSGSEVAAPIAGRLVEELAAMAAAQAAADDTDTDGGNGNDGDDGTDG